MGSRLSFVFLVLVISFVSANARSVESFDEIIMQMDNKVQGEGHVGRSDKMCTLCEEYASQAIAYLAANETQTQIITALRQICSQLRSLEKQCISVVDYYLPMFFLELSELSPEKLCEKANLCGEAVLLKLPKSEACSLCHSVVVEVLTKLKDPDTQLEVMETLLDGCSKMGNFAQQCKKLVVQYGELILINAQTFLETTDVCTAIHACKDSQDLTSSALADA